MARVIKATIQFHRGLAATWASNNPTLAYGEPGFEKDTGKHFNACFKYEDFMFEKFGIFLTDNHLSDKNKDILKKAEENTRLKEKQEQGTLF